MHLFADTSASALFGGEIQMIHWMAFAVFVTVMLTLDLTVFHKKSHEPSLRESAFWTLFWSALALAFNGLVWWWLGSKPALEFLTGYLVEWSLSMDNVFVFAVVFAYFGVPLKYQYRVLFWGILGAVIMRLTFVLLGAELVERYKWILWVFGGFLIYTGIKLALGGGDHEPGENALIRFFRRFIPVSKEPAGDRFFVREGGKLLATPLFLVLLVVESTDVLFAVDSVPAILGVVTPGTHYMRFIAFTSNVFAILGQQEVEGRRDGPLPVPQLRPLGGARVRGLQDDRRGGAAQRVARRPGGLGCPRQGASHSSRSVARGHRVADRCERGRVAGLPGAEARRRDRRRRQREARTRLTRACLAALAANGAVLAAATSRWRRAS